MIAASAACSATIMLRAQPERGAERSGTGCSLVVWLGTWFARVDSEERVMKRFFLALVLGACSMSAQSALIDRGDGLIYDSNQNITWLQDANYAFTNGDIVNSWPDAIAWANGLIYTNSGGT